MVKFAEGNKSWARGVEEQEQRRRWLDGELNGHKSYSRANVLELANYNSVLYRRIRAIGLCIRCPYKSEASRKARKFSKLYSSMSKSYLREWVDYINLELRQKFDRFVYISLDSDYNLSVTSSRPAIVSSKYDVVLIEEGYIEQGMLNQIFNFIESDLNALGVTSIKLYSDVENWKYGTTEYRKKIGIIFDDESLTISEQLFMVAYMEEVK